LYFILKKYVYICVCYMILYKIQEQGTDSHQIHGLTVCTNLLIWYGYLTCINMASFTKKQDKVIYKGQVTHCFGICKIRLKIRLK